MRFSDLLSGEVEIQGRKIPTVPLTSHVISLEIADTLKAWIEKGEVLFVEAGNEPALLVERERRPWGRAGFLSFAETVLLL